MTSTRTIKSLLKMKLGLRAIDFIFRVPGVNRPLTLADGRAENLNKTFYRDQVNKVANCIKETISSLKGGSKLASVSQPDYACIGCVHRLEKNWHGPEELSFRC